VAGAALAMFAPPGQGTVGASVRMGHRTPYPYGAALKFRRGLGLFHIGVRKHVQVDTTLTNPLQSQTLGQKGKISRFEVVPGIALHQIRQ